LLGYVLGNVSLEKALHTQWDLLRIRHSGEWFNCSNEIAEWINSNNVIQSNWIELDDDSGKVRIYKRMKNF